MQTRLALFGLLVVFCGWGCDGTAAVDGGVDPVVDTGNLLVDAPLMDAAITPTDVGAEPDGALADAGSTTDAAVAVDAPTASDAGAPLSCSSLPECAASKGCGPTLATACCCGGTVFDPATAIGCCCGFGIVPGAMLTCEG